MNIEKVKEALENIANRDWVDNALDPQWASGKAKEALAELEKTTSESEIEELANALEVWNRAQWSFRHMAHDLCEYWGVRGAINFGAYHDKKCAECTQKKALYRLFGVD